MSVFTDNGGDRGPGRLSLCLLKHFVTRSYHETTVMSMSTQQSAPIDEQCELRNVITKTLSIK